MRKKKKIYRSKMPTHQLKLKSRDPDSPVQSTVGVGWLNSAGGISVKLNPGVSLSWLLNDDFMLTVWPLEDEEDEDEEDDYEYTRTKRKVRK